MHRKSAMMAAPFQILTACRNNGHQVRNMLRYSQICFLAFTVTIAMALFWFLTGQIAPSNMLKSIMRKDAATKPAFADMRATNTTMWRDIFVEDVFVVEGMQKGRHSSQYDGGKFSAVMDAPTHHFHKWVATALSG